MLSIGGDLDVAEAMALVEQHFGDVPARAVPPRPDFDEPPPKTERRAEHVDPQAPAPAVALGWRVPDPADLDDYLPYVVLTSALTTGDASRLRRRLVHEDRLATDVGSHLGFMEDPFDVRNPSALVLEAHHGADVRGDRVVKAVDEELDRLATDGLGAGELERVQARLGSAVVQGQDHVLGRVLSMAVFEQQRGRAELVGELPALLGQVGADQVVAAAAALRPQNRARLDVVTGGR